MYMIKWGAANISFTLYFMNNYFIESRFTYAGLERDFKDIAHELISSDIRV